MPIARSSICKEEESIKERNRVLRSVGIKVPKSNANQPQRDVINESQSIGDSTRSNEHGVDH
ncbi:hypothetical protein PABG_12441 [Paracoccidioides brasiliensis Pb03]|nr:hypothetical protein PABG_12441 [Paracoccidioides brasiliensis Pb03]